MKARIAQLVDDAIARLPEIGNAKERRSISATVERTRDPRHGDFATNIAMRLAKSTGKNPRELANAIIAELADSELIEKVDIAGPGFINFHVSDTAFRQELESIVAACDDYGRQPLHQLLSTLADELGGHAAARRVRWSIDVDPIELF